jgi:hypothetical protein
MASSFPNGTIFSLGTVLAAAKTITSISNASPAVASSTAHGYAAGDIVKLGVASALLDQRVVRVAANVSPTDLFNLEGIDTSSTTLYPTGFGVGTAQKVTTWVPFSQVTDVQASGGEQQFYQWTYLEDGRQRQRPTFKNARSMTLQMDYDPSLAWHAALLAADQLGGVYPLQAALPTGAKLYYSVYVGFDGEPGITINENMKTTATLSLASPYSTRYAS